ncbi:MAG: SMP-30/gluconolactonase/LRE family protein [Caulobacterales bacterium]|nr:SMP-30/gluconolactonase/LRE family protein [Caulobacterales bacterium]
MRLSTTWTIVIVVIALALPSALAVRAANRAGEFTTLAPRFDGTCRRLDGFVGPEDLALDAERGLLYAAGEDRRALKAGAPTRGAIWALEMDALDAAEPVDLTGGTPADFHPLGIDLHIDAEGVRRLFVVNRASGGHRVELFRVTDAGDLAHERSFDDPALINPNDVAAAGPDRAYVTLDKKAPTASVGEVVEGLLERPNGKVLLVSPQGVRTVADGLIYANGLALIEEGAGLAVAETVRRAIALYDRDAGSGELTLRERVFLGTGADNITRDAAGRLFIAAHPKLLTFAMGHARTEDADAPSQVIVMDVAERRVDQLFLSSGVDISGASAAVVDVEARRMVMGSVYEPFLMACELPEVWRHSEAYPASRPVQRRAVPR